MEYIYFVRLDLNIVGINVYIVWKNMGWNLVKELLVKVDMVVGVFNFFLLVVSGYVEVSGIFYEIGLVKN